MFDAVLKTTNSSFQKGMAFCRSIYVKKVMKLLAYIFEQPSYSYQFHNFNCYFLFIMQFRHFNFIIVHGYVCYLLFIVLFGALSAFSSFITEHEFVN